MSRRFDRSKDDELPVREVGHAAVQIDAVGGVVDRVGIQRTVRVPAGQNTADHVKECIDLRPIVGVSAGIPIRKTIPSCYCRERFRIQFMDRGIHGHRLDLEFFIQKIRGL